jgi:hypothetical protein
LQDTDEIRGFEAALSGTIAAFPDRVIE